jgi:hypothetical protein
MDRAYLLIAGVLTGAAVGMLSGHLTYWIAAGVAIGLLLSASARRRHPMDRKQTQKLTADS